MQILRRRSHTISVIILIKAADDRTLTVPDNTRPNESKALQSERSYCLVMLTIVGPWGSQRSMDSPNLMQVYIWVKTEL